MRNLNIDTGLESFTVNGDENRVISFDPGDFNIIARADEAVNRISEYMESLKEPATGNTIETLRQVNEKICGEVDFIFGEGAAKAAFNGMCPISVNKEGVTIFQQFFEAIVPLVKETVEANMKASQERIAKYTKNAK